MWGEFLVGFTAGLAATPHCLGMCGGFPLHLAKSSNNGNAVIRQVLFILGKSFTYMFLGTLAASFGAVLLRDTALKPGALYLRLSAGILTVLFGLLMLGIRLPRIRLLQNAADIGFVRSLFSGFLSNPGPLSAFLLGLGVGFLPCPLPMGMLAIAAGTRDVPLGMVLMAGVGFGTAPGLLGVGLFGMGLDRKLARVGMRAAGAVVILVGLLVIARASGLIPPEHPLGSVVPACCQGR